MSIPRLYSIDDAGSPGINLTGNLQNRLKQILVPCLVTGYGNKPGAGWTLAHEHENGFTLHNGEGYINFVSDLPAQGEYPAMHGDSVHIYIAESLTDSSEAVIKGAGLTSGNYRAGTPEADGFQRHILDASCTQNELNSLRWVVAADAKSFLISCSSSSSGSVYGQLSLACTGQAALGGELSSYSSYGRNFTLSPSSALANPLTGLAQDTASLSAYPHGQSTSYRSHSTQAAIPPVELFLQRPRVTHGKDFTGEYVCGVVYDDAVQDLGGTAVFTAFGLPNPSDFNNRCKIMSAGGHNYAWAPSYGGGLLLTDDPRAWA